jgi:hypothetical protein
MKRRVPDKPTEHELEAEGLPSASGFDTEFRCPGKRSLCARLPREEDTAVANRGKRIHAALAAGDFSDLAQNEERTASRITYGESEIVHEYGFEGALIEFEERVWDFDDDLNKTWSGRVDRYDWMPNERRLLVIDDKSGWTTPPPIYKNWQLRSEGALLAERLDAIETVVALIHPHHPDSLWEAEVYNRKQTDDLLATVRHNVVKIQLPDQPLVYGQIQCQWCEAKRICPEYQRQQENLRVAIADEIADEGMTALLRRSKKQRGDHVYALKDEQKNIVFILGKYVELMEREGDDSIAGWRLARKMDRSVTNENEAIEIVRNSFGTDALYASLTFNLTALEKELAKTRTMKEAKSLVRTALGKVLKYTKSKNFLEEARSL